MHGRFPASDAIALLSAFVHSKIRYHEERIARGEVQEEDLLMRERRIIELQQWLRETRERMQGADEVDVEALFHWRAV